MDLDPFLLSLIQVAFVVSFHIIFPPLATHGTAGARDWQAAAF
jgi:hypothetical protein